MKIAAFWIAASLAVASLGVGSARAGDVTRREAMEIAAAYQNFVWQPGPQNAFHGKDHGGIQADTPDAGFQPHGARPGWWVAGQKNVGVPYKWGGFSSLEEFAAGVRAGRHAGDVYTADKRRLLDAAISDEAVGIDCSGLICRCWKLDRHYSTRTLPTVCQALASYDDLKPGDILNVNNNHVLLFKGWADATRARLFAYESGAPAIAKVLLDDMPVAMLRERGYLPYRYRQMRD